MKRACPPAAVDGRLAARWDSFDVKNRCHEGLKGI
jgi:hypothetical protein